MVTDGMLFPSLQSNLHLGCSYHLHSSHRFLSTWGVVMLEKRKDEEYMNTPSYIY